MHILYVHSKRSEPGRTIIAARGCMNAPTGWRGEMGTALPVKNSSHPKFWTAEYVVERLFGGRELFIEFIIGPDPHSSLAFRIELNFDT